jgi:hypothetical protein
MAEQTWGEQRARLLDQRVEARNKTVTRMLGEFRLHDWSESELALETYDAAWNDGYKAGFQAALDSTKAMIEREMRAMRTSIGSKGLR